jgi:hypothetical protein
MMTDIVFGDEHENIRLAPGAHSRQPSGLEVCEIRGSFQTRLLRGEFSSMLSLPIARSFLERLEQFNKDLSGEIKFRCGLDHQADLELKMTFERLGGIWVHAAVAQPGMQAQFAFKIDQSYLPPLINAVRKTAMAAA